MASKVGTVTISSVVVPSQWQVLQILLHNRVQGGIDNPMTCLEVDAESGRCVVSELGGDST